VADRQQCNLTRDQVTITAYKQGKHKRSFAACENTSPLRELTRHMGSHSGICHPSEVTFPPLSQPVKAGSLVLDLATQEGFKAELWTQLAPENGHPSQY